jgi:hypothetical protein
LCGLLSLLGGRFCGGRGSVRRGCRQDRLGGEDAPIDENLVEVIDIDIDELGGLFDEQGLLLEEDVGEASPKENREFGADGGFVEGEVVGAVDRELYGYCLRCGVVISIVELSLLARSGGRW